MFGSQILDVAIGLIFVYLLSSLICTVINEMFAKILKLRTKTLRKGIQKIITGQKDTEDKNVKDFFEHSLIKSLSLTGHPSYISSREFALALIDIVAPNKQGTTRVFEDIRQAIIKKLPDGSYLKQALLLLISEAGENLKELNKNIEKWFDDVMERISGIYKRRLQLITLLVALVVGVGMNVDTLAITNSLYQDETIRSSIVAIAEETAKKSDFIESDTSLTRIKEIQTELQQLRIPMGWDKSQIPSGWGWLTKIFGWILTILAISLGAPFWFEVLNKFVNLRSAGSKPKTSEELDKAKDKNKTK